jgi:hypothetical protein
MGRLIAKIPPTNRGIISRKSLSLSLSLSRSLSSSPPSLFREFLCVYVRVFVGGSHRQDLT